MMKKITLIMIFAITLFVVNNHEANAQEKRLNSSPKAFRTFFSEFKGAVVKNEKTRVAAITQFPFRYGFDAGDEGTMSKPQFIKGFNRIFGEKPKDFFTETNPLFSIGNDGSYTISTEDAAHLVFKKKGKIFKFSAFIVEP